MCSMLESELVGLIEESWKEMDDDHTKDSIEGLSRSLAEENSESLLAPSHAKPSSDDIEIEISTIWRHFCVSKESDRARQEEKKDARDKPRHDKVRVILRWPQHAQGDAGFVLKKFYILSYTWSFALLPSVGWPMWMLMPLQCQDYIG